jgi:hypothetical protein
LIGISRRMTTTKVPPAMIHVLDASMSGQTIRASFNPRKDESLSFRARRLHIAI